ncbi:AI-2E family transporter [Nonomuraea glycinis]|uniref:AI-2E family transporter n=2 Tax=Nonomuraea glycinis TaxID=2047744 RepID=A0A918A5A0_9ACTN|nr:AI-2E family transporter [Nonomuraea glycinis]MCA2183263.1 AI-2E family transporter [Nonomuraea glycinis]GGP04395.1 AI-2E family transporter [Nonomuraea glycinis]
MPRALIILVGIAGAVILLFGIREVSSIVGPFVLALVLVIAVSPVRTWLAARRAPIWVQVAVPFLILVMVLLAMAGVLTISAVQLGSLVPSYTREFQALLVDAQNFAVAKGVSNEQLDRAIESFDPQRIIGIAQSLLGGVIGVFSGLFLIVVLLLAMCLDAPATARILSTSEDRRPAVVTALDTFAHKTRRYLIVSTVFGLINAVLNVLALTVIGVPLPLLWGVLALIANYIPNIGFVLSLMPPAALALLDGGVKQMLLVIAAYTAINVVTQSFILPKFLGDAVGLSTTMTFISLIVWTFVLGPLGAVLAIPLSLLTKALLIDSDPAAKWAAALVSNRPPP